MKGKIKWQKQWNGNVRSSVQKEFERDWKWKNMIRMSLYIILYIIYYKHYIGCCLIRVWSTKFFSSPASFLLISTWSAFLLSPLFIFLCFCLPLSLSLCLTLSRCIAPVSRLPARQCGPGGSNQLNYWEHKNAAANGSWINTLAKLLPRLPLLPQGIKLKILRLRMQRLEATAEALSGAGPQLRHTPGHTKDFGVQGASLMVVLVIYWQQVDGARIKN